MTAAISSQGVPAFLSALENAREGMQQGVESFAQVAQKVAGAVADPAQVSVRNEVAAMDARDQVAASARVFETGDQMLGTILDLRA